MQRKILIIDDEEDLCMMIVQYLVHKDYTVEYAHTLENGMRKLNDMHPDTLLLDNNLPDGLGWKEADKIQRLYPEMQITLISANEATPYSIMAYGIGFRKMEKPITFKTLDTYL
ncbi:MAG: response regulator [Bacteroidota bacterium]